MEIKKLIEAALFMAGREVKRSELAMTLNLDEDLIDQVVCELIKTYEAKGGSIKIRKIGDTYKMDIDTKYLTQVKKLAPVAELKRAHLKTLAYVAYKQPVLQSELVKIMGNRTYEYVRHLCERGFITGVKKGRTKELKTTEKFTMYFGVDSLDV